MGIDITEDKEILFNDTHQQLVNTDINTNPTTLLIHDMTIYSIYRRIKTKGHIGDGNPFIYALKIKKGYKISKDELKKFLPSFNSILNKILQDKEYDLVLVLPSNSNIAKRVAKRASSIVTPGVPFNDIFSKCTITDIIKSIDITQIPPKHTKNVKRQLSKLNSMDGSIDFSMKEVEAKIREYFKPVQINDKFDFSQYKRILLVDDLFATGNTLKTAKEAIKNIDSTVKIDGLCLFSGL